MLITKCNSAAKNERAQISAKPSCMGVIIGMFPKLLQLQQKQKRKKKKENATLQCNTKERGIKTDGAVGTRGASAIAPRVWHVESCDRCAT